MKTFSKHVKYRVENKEIFICFCKELLDFKIDIKYLPLIQNIQRGLNTEILDNNDKILIEELNRFGGLIELQIKPIQKKDYTSIYNFLTKHLHLVRTKEFLLEKLKQYPHYFKGLYLDHELIGVIQGFPREDYILISEIAIEQRFRNRGFGHLLVKEFEKETTEKIKVGAENNAINFYKSLNFKPSIFMQFKKKNFNQNTFKDYKILYQKEYDEIIGVEIEFKEISLYSLDKLKNQFKPYSIQYLFTKTHRRLLSLADA